MTEVGEPIGRDGLFARIDPTFVDLDLQANAIALAKARRQLNFDTREVKRYQALVASRASAQTRLDQLQLQRDHTRLTIRELENTRKRLQEQLARHQIMAPPGFLLVKRLVEPGQWVSRGQRIGQAGDYHQLLVPLAVTAHQLHILKARPTIPVHLVDADITGHGSLFRISPAFDPKSHKTRLEILLNNETVAQLDHPQGGLRVMVTIREPAALDSFLVPASAVVERYEEHWLIRPNGSQLRIIVLGAAPAPAGRTGSWVRVANPSLNSHDTFLLDPNS